jgi:serine/threonine protein kinase
MTVPSSRELPPILDSSSGVREPVELLADEFLARRRRGERPTVKEYEGRYPELAASIRNLFPALILMENLDAGSLGVPASPVDRSAATAAGRGSISAPVPDQLGDYRILREIGRGGMGIVYEAEQGSLGRRVALKILPLGALTNPVQVRRFEREARAAGRLHHTNIVPVFGVGREGDNYYYVMQYIQGQPLSDVLAELRLLRQGARAAVRAGSARAESGADMADPTAPPTAAEVARSLWADAFAPAAIVPGSTDALLSTATGPKGGSPDPPQVAGSGSQPDSNPLVRTATPTYAGRRYFQTVARLGIQAAEALDYAWQQGVLHRDVKPSNLLLDVRGTLWVTDFGLAKLSGSEDLTHTGDILGTLRYMAPERFRGQSDVRSDVYGLGLTLYELLALRPAFEEADRSRLIDMITRAELPQLLKLDPTIPRDLATIVHKAIACESSDRYHTAGELAADLARFLQDRPINARRLSPAGVAWRWARRNKAVASLLGLVAALLIGITAGSMIVADRYRAVARRATQASLAADAARERANDQARDATRARNESDANAARANAARAEADQSAAESKAVVAFVTGDVLGAAAPSNTRGEAITVLEALANADRALEGKFAKEPRVEASVREALAKVYQELGEYEKAEGHAARALAVREKILGPEHEATLSAMFTCGWTYYQLGKYDKHEQGEALFRRMLEICRRTRGDDTELTLQAMNGLAAILGGMNKLDEAATLDQRIVDIRRRTNGPEDRQTLSAIHNHAIALKSLGRLKEAEPLLREVVQAEIKNQPDHPSTLNSMSNYASLLDDLGREEAAAAWAMRSMETHLRVLKFKHPKTQAAIGAAVGFTMLAGKEEEALQINDRMLEQARRELGLDDFRTQDLLEGRGGLLHRLGDRAGARSAAEELVAARTRKPGPEDPKTLSALAIFAMILRDEGASAQARTLMARLRDDARRALNSAKTKPLDPDAALGLRRWLAFAEVVGRNLDRPERSDAAPGTPGGPPQIDAPYRPESPVADGRITPGEYGDGDGFAFDFADDRNPGRSYLFDEITRATKDPSDLSVRRHAAHSGTALFLAFRVRDQSVQADPVAAKAPYTNDGVELFLDGDRMPDDLTGGTISGNLEGFQIIADALGNRLGSTPAVGNSRWKAGTARTADGYVIEFEIPLDLIDTQNGPGFRPAATGSELRMNVGINDIDEAINKQTFYGMMWAEDRLWSPLHGGEDFWPVALRLVPAPQPSP